jgi:hypothetical protein
MTKAKIFDGSLDFAIFNWYWHDCYLSSIFREIIHGIKQEDEVLKSREILNFFSFIFHNKPKEAKDFIMEQVRKNDAGRN